MMEYIAGAEPGKCQKKDGWRSPVTFGLCVNSWSVLDCWAVQRKTKVCIVHTLHKGIANFEKGWKTTKQISD